MMAEVCDEELLCPPDWKDLPGWSTCGSPNQTVGQTKTAGPVQTLLSLKQGRQMGEIFRFSNKFFLL